MVCNMCDPDGNPCDRCKIQEMEERNFSPELPEEVEAKI